MLTTHATLDTWLSAHPYLQELARFQQLIEEELRGSDAAVLPLPAWEEFAEDFTKGIPVLKSKPLDPVVINAAALHLTHLVERLTGAGAPDTARAACALLRQEFLEQPHAASNLIRSIISGQEQDVAENPQANPGLNRFLCWKVLQPLLRTWIENLPALTGDVVWGRPYCPVCGSLPAMGQLSQTKKGRERFLSCGCCGNTWTFSRTTCPFCDNHDQDKLEILEAEQEELFRIDVCRECNGYLKTYLNEGDEEHFLADWSTLHLDVLAKNKGLMRKANSLYEV